MKHKHKNFITLDFFFIAAFLAACGVSTTYMSDTKEAWNEVNDPEIFGVDSMTLRELQAEENLTGFQTEIPWSDTYWPLYEIGMANRWINTNILPPHVYASDTTLEGQEYVDAVLQDVQDAAAETRDLFTQGGDMLTYMSPAEKYDYAFSANIELTVNELLAFANNRKTYDDLNMPWGWMGHCHGWAPATIAYEAPRHGVKIINEAGDSSILFTEGDIRGLLTKAAADNGFDMDPLYLGSRCNDSDREIVRDKKGRVIDAMLGQWMGNAEGEDLQGEGNKFTAARNIKIYANNWFNHSELASERAELVFSFHGDNASRDNVNGDNANANIGAPEKYWLAVVGYHPEGQRQGIFKAELYSVRETAEGQLLKDRVIATETEGRLGCVLDDSGLCQAPASTEDLQIAEGTWNKIWEAVPPDEAPAFGRFIDVKYFKSCRDLNAGSFHLLLAQRLGVASSAAQVTQGFVLDITRDQEVWNHPVYGYRSKIGIKTPVSLSENNALNADEDTSSAGVDPYGEYRSPMTKSIVDVYTQVFFGVENGPYVAFEEADNKISYKNYHYTLELNEQDQVIGGEWHVVDEEWNNLPASEAFAAMTALSGNMLLERLQREIDERQYHIDPVTGEPILHRLPDFPDFIWAPRPGAQIKDGEIISARYVRELHACSIAQMPLLQTLITTQQCRMETSPQTGEAVKICEEIEKSISFAECKVNVQRPNFSNENL